MPVMTARPLLTSDDDRATLDKVAHSTSSSHRPVLKSKALLWVADGVANEEIARRCEVAPDSVPRGRSDSARRASRVSAVAKGRGRKSWLAAGTLAEIIRHPRGVARGYLDALDEAKPR
jgi:hypothetical protein